MCQITLMERYGTLHNVKNTHRFQVVTVHRIGYPVWILNAPAKPFIRYKSASGAASFCLHSRK